MFKYLRSLWRRVNAAPLCAYCGEPWPDRYGWMLHLGYSHPTVAEPLLYLYRQGMGKEISIEDVSSRRHYDESTRTQGKGW
jgi:hypothetical protein